MLKSPDPIPPLSARESQVARSYADGASYKEIAAQLGISPATVRTHLNTIFRKLDVSNKVELLRVIQRSDQKRDGRAESPRLTGTPRPRLGGWRSAALVVSVVLTLGLGFKLLDAGPRIEPVPVAFEGPSIAVLPIDYNGDTDTARTMLASINRDIVTDLSQFSDIFVISAGTSFRPEFIGAPPRKVGAELGVRYVLHGTADWRGDLMNVNLQLVETDTAQVVWSEQYATSMDRLLDFQTEVSTRVISLIGPVETGSGALRDVELARVKRLATDQVTAYDLFIQAFVYWERFTKEDNARAYQLFMEAIEIDPDYGKAYGMAAWTRVVDVWNQRVDEPEAVMEEARALLDRGFEVDPNEPYMHWALGGYHLFRAEHDLSIAAFRRAVELNPNSADLRVYLGWALVYAGEAEAAVAEMELATKLNPRHPGWYLWDFAFAEVFLGNYGTAAAILESRQPKTPGTYELLAISYALNGEEEKASAAVEKLLELRPGLTVSGRSQLEPFIDPEDRRKYFDAMLLAGIPEG